MTQRKSVLVIGGGSIGERHVRCLLATGRARVSLCDSNEAICARVVESYGLDAVFASLDEALAAPPDAVVVATPAHLHVPMVRRAVAAGCHALIEKPLSTSEEDLDELADEAGERQRIVGAAYVLRHNPGLAAVRQLLVEGAFGPPLELVYVGGQDFPHFRPAYREIYYRDRATGGGAIQDALTHYLNAGQWLVGTTRSVAADAAHLALEGVSVEDTVHVVARHAVADGPEVLASYALNQHQPPNESTLSVICRDGAIRWEPHANRWLTMSRGASEWTIHDYEPLERDALFTAQSNAFLDAVEGRRPVATKLAEARATLRAALAILEAADSRRWVDIPPVA